MDKSLDSNNLANGKLKASTYFKRKVLIENEINANVFISKFNKSVITHEIEISIITDMVKFFTKFLISNNE